MRLNLFFILALPPLNLHTKISSKKHKTEKPIPVSKFDESSILLKLKDSSTRRRAFEEVVNHYSSSLYWQIRHIVVDHDDADDVLQNTFLKAWSNIDSFRGEAKLNTWLYKIAYNESITFLKQKKDAISIDSEEGGVAHSLESDKYFDGDETQMLLQQAIETLPAKQKAVFTMKYFDEMKYEDMSEVTGTSIGALKASYHLAVEKITKFFHSKE